jgi:hypothetical protein
MAAWLTAYCTKPVGGVTADDLLADLDRLDLWTLAEVYGIEDEEEAVDAALAHLRIEPVTGRAGVKFALRYKPRNLRPIFVHHWTARSRVRAECAEALEQFEGAKGRDATRVRERLAKCTEVVAVELGLRQLEDMGLVLAAPVAQYFAARGGGVIRDQNGDWWAMSRNRTFGLLVGRRGGS